MFFDPVADGTFCDSQVIRHIFYRRFLSKIAIFHGLFQSPPALFFPVCSALFILRCRFLPRWKFCFRLNISQCAHIIQPMARVIKP